MSVAGDKLGLVMNAVEQRPSERSDSLRALAALLQYARDEAGALRLPFLFDLLTMARVEVVRNLPNEPSYEPIIVGPDVGICSDQG